MRRVGRGTLARVGIAMGCAAMAGCGQLVSFRPDDPLTVSVTLAQAGVRDERQAFAAVMLDELGASDRAAAAQEWLHGVRLSGPDEVDPGPAGIDRRFLARRSGAAVMVIPGMFGDCVAAQSVPFGDGVERTPAEAVTAAYGAYADLGLHSLRMVPLPGRVSTEANGAALAAAIREQAAAPGVSSLVLVGYSKGVPDAMQALALLHAAGEMPAVPVALVSVAGTVMGTPLADRFEGWYDTWAPRRAVFGCTPADGEELASMTRRERLRWWAVHELPPTLARYSIVAYAAPADTGPLLRVTQSILAEIDPRNDGQMIAGDAILPGSELLATARADHWDIALPRDRHESAWVRDLQSGRHYPREALFRAVLRWVVGRGS